MKKMMVALVAVAFAAVAQAAAFNWTTTGTNAAKTFYGADGSTIAGAMVYLIDAGVTSQSDLIDGLRDGKTIADFASVTSATLDSNSRLAAKEFSYGEAGQYYSFYMAVIADDSAFVSASITLGAQQSDVVDVKYSGIKTATQTNLGDADYSSAGWYSTAAVPEPTSGLLMLLGMAGLALRRRRT